MRKYDVIKKVSKLTGIPKTDVLITLEAFFQEVKNSVKDGENVYVRGFGSFIAKKRKGRMAMNISKREKVFVPAHYQPVFLPAKVFMDMVKQIPIEEEKV